MSTVPARVAADAKAADESLQSLAAAAATPPEPAPTEQAPEPPESPQAPVTPVPDLAAELRRMQHLQQTTEGRLAQIQAQNEALLRQQQERVAAPAPAPAAPPPAPLITDKDREDYGDDMLDLINRAARQLVAPIQQELKELRAQLAGMEGKVGKVAQTAETVAASAEQQAFDAYIRSLDNLIPGWQAVNEDPAFVDWLKNIDETSGRTLQQLLEDAHNRANAKRVAHIFKLYKPDLGTSPAATPAPAAPQAPTAPQTVDPASLAAPNTSKASVPATTPQPGKVWTQQEVDALYVGKQKGLISQADFATREADYFKALAEGRVAVTA